MKIYDVSFLIFLSLKKYEVRGKVTGKANGKDSGQIWNTSWVQSVHLFSDIYIPTDFHLKTRVGPAVFNSLTPLFKGEAIKQSSVSRAARYTKV